MLLQLIANVGLWAPCFVFLASGSSLCSSYECIWVHLKSCYQTALPLFSSHAASLAQHFCPRAHMTSHAAARLDPQFGPTGLWTQRAASPSCLGFAIVYCCQERPHQSIRFCCFWNHHCNIFVLFWHWICVEKTLPLCICSSSSFKKPTV